MTSFSRMRIGVSLLRGFPRLACVKFYLFLFLDLLEFFFLLWLCHLRVRSSSLIRPALCPSFFGMLSNLYVPVAFPPNMLKLQWFCVSGWSGIWLYVYFSSILLSYYFPSFVLSKDNFIVIVSIWWSMLCIWCLFLWIASFRISESNAFLIDWSDFTVMTTGLMKCSSEHFIIFLFVFRLFIFWVLLPRFLLNVVEFVYLCVV